MSGKIDYPSITFWDKKAEKIEIINRDGLREEQLLKVLGLDGSPLRHSFGVSDRDEIMRRQRLMKFFVHNPRSRKFFERMDIFVTHLPQTGQEFLDYFNSKNDHNPFWVLVNGFVGKFSKVGRKVPQEIQSFVNFLKQTKESMEEDEGFTIDGITEKLKNSAYLTGVIDFTVGTKHGYHVSNSLGEMHGHKKYAFGSSGKWKKFHIPEWATDSWWRFTGVGLLLEGYAFVHRMFNDYLLYSSMIIEGGVGDSIVDAIRELIAEVVIERRLQEWKYSSVSLKINFTYSDGGLKVCLLDVSANSYLRHVDREEEQKNLVFTKDDFPGYSSKEAAKSAKRNEEYLKKVYELKTRFDGRDVMVLLEETDQNSLRLRAGLNGHFSVTLRYV